MSPRLPLAAAAALATLSMVQAPAHADVNLEAGVTAGAHLFSVNNELGVPDSSDAASLRNSVLFGVRLGYYFSRMLGVEGELGLIPTEARVGTVDVSVLTYRVHLVAQFGAADPAHKWIPFVLGGLGQFRTIGTEDKNVITIDGDEVIYVGAGVKYRIGKAWGARADLRVLFPPSSADEFAAVDYEGLVSVYREWGRPEGAPPPQTPDTDGDGFKDDVDQCIDHPEDVDQFEDTDGCPDYDNDKDEILDADDGCPMNAEDMDEFEDTDGCPEDDNDKDTFPDTTDGCPNDAEDVDQFQDDDGCPELDNDNDTFLDPQDACPIEAETPNGYQDDDGCPDDLPKALQEFTGVIAGITFELDSDKIKKSSNKTLDAAVKILVEYPDTHLEIQGHTDDTGDEAYNIDLSQRRAEAVRQYFIKAGIAEDRIIAKGYGKSVPLSDKTTKAARAKNRRVEFKLISQTP